MRLLFALALFWSAPLISNAQETRPVNDVHDIRTGAYAFVNATVHTDFETVRQDASILIRDGRIVAVNASTASVPDGYVTVDMKGRHIYPALIDIDSNYGIPEPKREPAQRFQPEQIQTNTEGPFNANEAIKSEYDAFAQFEVNDKAAKAYRDLGFGAVNTYRSDGIARGTSAVVTLANDTENNVMVASQAAAHYSFDKGTSRQMYPSSLMGYIALVRQTHYDAAWYTQLDPQPFVDKSLDAWTANSSLPQIFSVNNWQSVLRADKLGDEFGIQYVIRSGGDEYRRVDAVKATGATLIVPVDFPEAYDVDDPLDAYRISYENMMHWEAAPTNLAQLEQAGIDFAITTSDLKDKKKFWDNVRKAIKHGLSETAALKALTATPASILGVEDRIGSLQQGREANFIVASGNLFDEKTMLLENWIQGKRYEIKDTNRPDLAGVYSVTTPTATYSLEISGEPDKHSAKIVVNDSTSHKASIEFDHSSISLSFDPDGAEGASGTLRMSGWLTEAGFDGSGQTPEGGWFTWSATRESASEGDSPDEETEEPAASASPETVYPFTAYGFTEIPEAQNVLIQNATVWTMEDDTRVMENSDVLVRDGKIVDVGKDLSTRGVTIVDGTGKHVTPGIIDEHSHIAAASINDVATNSGMVRIGDVIDSDDIGIYRALSGGVTAVQILHGSANPIGGQSALIKLRWGSLPEEMKIKGADGFIKFALGENVKRSRSVSSIRYPQTRMGVEQVYMDAFSSGRDYEREWSSYNALSAAQKRTTPAPRRDLVMDTMVEILNSERFVTSHSYVQSEINMLMKVADQFDFRINTFTHILEGYKVADKMAVHGVGASTFADWWAYKWEVRYAIPYNATIMMREGVVTAINSDDGEMMRRLNQEAAKSVKYGGLDEYDALKMVTINPARLLHLDGRMGSLNAGKDADVVVWSDNPLSIYARVEKTFVDGVLLYDAERDQETKADIARNRARIVGDMQSAKSGGKPTQSAMPSSSHTWQCEDVVVHREN
ncbi:MAG: amidohydrolase family protein [Rhodothermales bacterium]|nr:amidohydrolase family protein [Rhodothermales bacterium]